MVFKLAMSASSQWRVVANGHHRTSTVIISDKSMRVIDRKHLKLLESKLYAHRCTFSGVLVIDVAGLVICLNYNYSLFSMCLIVLIYIMLLPGSAENSLLQELFTNAYHTLTFCVNTPVTA